MRAPGSDSAGAGTLHRRKVGDVWDCPSSTCYCIDVDRYRYDIDDVVLILIGIDTIICATRGIEVKPDFMAGSETKSW